MARLTTDDVEELYARVIRLATEAGIDTSAWTLVCGELPHGDSKRVPYRISRGDARLFHLGYTRRSAVDSLIAIATAYELLLEAEAA